MPGVGAAIGGIATWLGSTAFTVGGTAVTVGGVIQGAVVLASIAHSARVARQAEKLADRNRNAYRNFRQPVAPRRDLYGRVRTAGPIIFAHNSNSRHAHLVTCLASHEVEEVESVWVLQKEITYDDDPESSTWGKVTGNYFDALMMHSFTGAPGQDIGARLADIVDQRPNGEGNNFGISFIEETDLFEEIAGLYALTLGWARTYESDLPEFSAIVKGKKIYDPRDGSTAYSPNGALVTADYLANRVGVSWDAINSNCLSEAADLCEESVALKGSGTERRYDINGIVTSEQRHDAVLKDMANAIAGSIRYVGGEWLIEAGGPRGVSVSFSEKNVLQEYDLAVETPDRDAPTGVRGTFFDSVTWQPSAFPSWQDPDLSGEPEKWLEIELPFCTSAAAAQRIARALYRRARMQRRLSIDLDLRGMLAKPGDIITFDAPDIGLDFTRQFEVDGWNLHDDGQKATTSLDLIEYSTDIWEWDETTDEQDMERGTVDLDSVRSKEIESPTVTETNLSTSSSFSADYGFAWSNPSLSSADLDRIEIALEVEVTTTNGTPQTVPVSDTATVDDGTESETIPLSYSYDPGYSYVSHEITKAELIAYFADGRQSSIANASEV